MSRPFHVDPLLSYARRDGDAVLVRLVLRDDPDLVPGGATLRLHADEDVRRVRVRVDLVDGRPTIRASIPSAGLGAHRVWRMRLRPDDRELRNLRTRLLVSDRQPVALLPGPSPKKEPVLPARR